MPSNPRTQKPPKRSSSKLNVVKFDTQHTGSPPSKKFKPMTAFAPSIPIYGNVEKPNSKGKAKEVVRDNERDDQLWVEMYEPTTEAELAVHKRKVEDVRRWFLEAFEGGPSGKFKKYRRILALTGPAGTGKTTTVRVIARELGFEILEWKNSVEAGFPRDDPSDDFTGGWDTDHETLFQKFQAFLTRASSCQNLFTSGRSGNASATQSSSWSSKAGSQRSDALSSTSKRKIILLEDLPNILHLPTQQHFHSALESTIASGDADAAPIVIIVSDAGLRGEENDEIMFQPSSSRTREVFDIRTVLPPSLLGSPYVTQISFNPIAPTLLRNALQHLLTTHFPHSTARVKKTVPSNVPSKEVIDMIVHSANGDIRSAIMGLQFACLVELPGKTKFSNGKARARVVLDAVTRREQSIALFQLMGKVLYNKRKGDPPNRSATASDTRRERDLDAFLKDPPPHPYLVMHNRRTSRVNVDTLYADSPIDSSLFSLYIHQNYTQFCDEMEECDGIAEWLSWVDSNGGETWYQANPHRFHLLTLGTLHSLPSPVPRRSQKFTKPEFFQARNQEKGAWDAVGDVKRWVYGNFGMGQSGMDGEVLGATSGWSMFTVATELGGVLKARDRMGSQTNRPPPSHTLFSRLDFTKDSGNIRVQNLGMSDPGNDVLQNDGDDDNIGGGKMGREITVGGWLESDDIDEF